MNRRSLILGLLACLPLSGIKAKKKKYIKFKKGDGYTCIDPKTKYKCSFRVIPDWEYEFINWYILWENDGNYVFNIIHNNETISIVIESIYLDCLKNNFEIVEK